MNHEAIYWMKSHKVMTAAAVGLLLVGGATAAAPKTASDSRAISIQFCEAVVDVIDDSNYRLFLDGFVKNTESGDRLGAADVVNRAADEALLISKSLRELDRDPQLESDVSNAAERLQEAYANVGLGHLRPYNPDDMSALADRIRSQTAATENFGDACASPA